MGNIFERYRKVRQYILETVHDLTTDQFNHIPLGFNNNIIWNLGHIISSQQSVCYLRAGKDLKIEDDIFDDYKSGTIPLKYADGREIDYLKELALTTIDTFEKDYLANDFIIYPAWTTKYGVELTDIEKAIEFLLFHEGIHLGYIIALKKCLRKNLFVL